MFGMTGVSLFKYAILLVTAVCIMGGAYWYVKSTNATMADLNKQVASLQQTTTLLQTQNDNLQKDVAMVTAIQDQTNAVLQNIRIQTNTNAQQIRAKLATATSPADIKTQVNTDTAAAFSNLEALSRK